ncbi:hypothetical protein [Qipengyuania flava]|uniref:hypothetical protein n=1 Tax=Qipengyuania flava TaxID=192812 RepID=UPI001C62FCA2|nr:hypothetical protein [Qipengyuania flava]QYJ05954.1 hypothetical protein KUV82_07540 [Qipengyuania flava]
MNTRTWLGITGAAALAFGGATAAMAQMYEKIRLVNSTGYTIAQIFISAGHKQTWEEDVLDWDVLEDGQTFDLDMRRADNTCDWDLRVVYSDGDEAVWDGLNLCDNWHFELFYNARTGETHLTGSS